MCANRVFMAPPLAIAALYVGDRPEVYHDTAALKSHHAVPSPASTPNKACSGRRGFVAVFERFLASSFSVAQVGSHPPPRTLTVGPPRHIRAHIEYTSES